MGFRTTARLAAVGLVLLLGATSCNSDIQSIRGSGMLTTEERHVEPFRELIVQGGLPVEVQVAAGSEYSMSVSIDRNLVELVEHEVDGDVLTLRATEPFRQSRRAVIEITTPHLVSVVASGGPRVRVSGLTGEMFQVDAGGGAGVRADGTVDAVHVDAGGGADVDLRDLVAEEAEVTAGGGADVEVQVSRALLAEASGGADIVVYGDPVDVVTAESGGGDITFR